MRCSCGTARAVVMGARRQAGASALSHGDRSGIGAPDGETAGMPSITARAAAPTVAGSSSTSASAATLVGAGEPASPPGRGVGWGRKRVEPAVDDVWPERRVGGHRGLRSAGAVRGC